jgi:hypothetical protein
MSTLRTNALEGVDAKNSITIVAGAGNVTTTNVQEGLCKAWVNFDGTAGSISNADNFNSSGLTDHGTGNYTASWTNALSSTNYSVSGIGGDNSVSSPIGMFSENSTPSTDSFKFFCTNASASVTDFKYVSILAHGDLA